MTSLEFFELLNEIDDKYVAEGAVKATNKTTNKAEASDTSNVTDISSASKAKKSRSKWWITIAPVACAAVIAGIIIMLQQNNFSLKDAATGTTMSFDSVDSYESATTVTNSEAPSMDSSSDSYAGTWDGGDDIACEVEGDVGSDSISNSAEGVEGTDSMELVESYPAPDGTGTVESIVPVDMAVDNGNIEVSPSLNAAVSEYGTGAIYRIVIDLYKDGVILDNYSEEAEAVMDRLAAAGYTVAVEEYNDGKVVTRYMTLHATIAQMEMFPVEDEYGYYLKLYGEVVEVCGYPLSYNAGNE